MALIIVMLATWKCGGVFMPIGNKSGKTFRDRACSTAGVSVIISESTVNERWGAALNLPGIYVPKIFITVRPTANIVQTIINQLGNLRE